MSDSLAVFNLANDTYEGVTVSKHFSYRKMKRGKVKERVEDAHLRLVIPVTPDQMRACKFHDSAVRDLPPAQDDTLPEMRAPAQVEPQPVEKITVFGHTDSEWQFDLVHPDYGSLTIIPASGLHLKEVVVERTGPTKYSLIVMAKRVGCDIMGVDFSPEHMELAWSRKSQAQREAEAAQRRDEEASKKSGKVKSNKDQLELAAAAAKPQEGVKLREMHGAADLDNFGAGEILSLEAGDFVKLAEGWRLREQHGPGKPKQWTSHELLQMHGESRVFEAVNQPSQPEEIGIIPGTRIVDHSAAWFDEFEVGTVIYVKQDGDSVSTAIKRTSDAMGGWRTPKGTLGTPETLIDDYGDWLIERIVKEAA